MQQEATIRYAVKYLKIIYLFIFFNLLFIEITQ